MYHRCLNSFSQKCVSYKERSHTRARQTDDTIFEGKYDKEHLVMYVNAPFENHSERSGMYVFIRKLYFRIPRGNRNFLVR